MSCEICGELDHETNQCHTLKFPEPRSAPPPLNREQEVWSTGFDALIADAASFEVATQHADAKLKAFKERWP